VPLITDLARVRGILDTDRAWAVYAIGDLAPGLVEHCEWHAPAAADDALVMLYRGFTPPILFAMGTAAALRPLFGELDAPHVSLHVREHMLEAMAGSYAPTALRRMWRMTVTAEGLHPASFDDVRPVGDADVEAVKALYADGFGRGEGPTFFAPDMLRQGTFRGIWRDGALVSVAGTHLYSAELGICAIGNIYTRSDSRGQGLGAQVTTAVVAHAIANGVQTIALNVSEHNPARRVYERLGFVTYWTFVEGEATRA
jgi:GNAT superfamily N-acetyltransferase